MDATYGSRVLPALSDRAAGDADAVLMTELPAEAASSYDQFVATAPSGHYSQTRAWARVATVGKPFEPLFFLSRREGRVTGAGLVLRTRISGVALPVAQVERGPVAASVNDLADVLAALHRCCLKKGILRVAAMPYWTGPERDAAEKALIEAGFADSQRFSGRHVRTLRLDLNALDNKNPWKDSSLSKVRQNIGRAVRAGATVRPGRREDLPAFREMQASLLALEGKKPPADKWYEALGDYFLGAGAAMFVSECQGVPISAVFITMHNGLATYALGATANWPLKFSKTVLSMTEAILWAKAAGCHTFDMGGIPMAGDSDAKRASIAEFKHSYSRIEAHLVHEHVRWF